MQLLGEKIHSEVTVLTSLRRSGDANDLARPALEDQKIANADVVAGDGNGVGRHTTLDDADVFTDTITDTGGSTLLIQNDLFTIAVMMVIRLEGMEDAVGGFLDAVAEGVVVTFVVVVAHVGSVPWYFSGGLCFYSDLFSRSGSGSTIELYVVSGVNASTIFAFGDVDFSFGAAGNFDIDLGFRVTVRRLTVAGKMKPVSKEHLTFEGSINILASRIPLLRKAKLPVRAVQ